MKRLLLLAAVLMAAPATAQDVESVEVQLLRSEADLRAATTRIRDIKGRIGRLNADQTAAELSAVERRRRMAVRIRAMYRMRHRGFLPLLFSADSPHELLRSARYLWWIVREDQRLVDRWAADVATAEQGRAGLDAQREELLIAAGKAAATREEALALRMELTGSRDWTPPAEIDNGSDPAPVVATYVVKRQRPRPGGATEEERAKVEVSRRVVSQGPPAVADVTLDLAAEPPPLGLSTEELVPAAAFELSRGLLPLPARGSISRSGFGIAIAAAEGRPIRAVHGGDVSLVRWIQGYGNVAIIDHGDDWSTVYGHAREFVVEPGQWVDSGDDIGFVGSTGSLVGPRLHFEVRSSRDAVDPLEWLKVPPGVRVER